MDNAELGCHSSDLWVSPLQPFISLLSQHHRRSAPSALSSGTVPIVWVDCCRIAMFSTLRINHTWNSQVAVVIFGWWLMNIYKLLLYSFPFFYKHVHTLATVTRLLIGHLPNGHELKCPCCLGWEGQRKETATGRSGDPSGEFQSTLQDYLD